jgi:uncharacterized membrane protein YbhN (UPF0104 family)
MAFCLSALYATYRILLIALVTCLPTYRAMAQYFKFVSQFCGFHLTRLHTHESSKSNIVFQNHTVCELYIIGCQHYFCIN